MRPAFNFVSWNNQYDYCYSEINHVNTLHFSVDCESIRKKKTQLNTKLHVFIYIINFN